MDYRLLFWATLIVSLLATVMGLILATADTFFAVEAIAGVGLPDDGEVICTCFGVTKGQIRVSCQNGNEDFESVKADTQAGASCGKCEDDCVKVINDFLATKQ